MLPYTPCPGSGAVRGFALGDVTETSPSTGKPSIARVSCVSCGRRLLGRVVRQTQGIRLDGRHVIVPNHKEP